MCSALVSILSSLVIPPGVSQLPACVSFWLENKLFSLKKKKNWGFSDGHRAETQGRQVNPKKKRALISKAENIIKYIPGCPHLLKHQIQWLFNYFPGPIPSYSRTQQGIVWDMNNGHNPYYIMLHFTPGYVTSNLKYGVNCKMSLIVTKPCIFCLCYKDNS